MQTDRLRRLAGRALRRRPAVPEEPVVEEPVFGAPVEPTVLDPLTTIGHGTYGITPATVLRYPGDEHPVTFGKFCSIALGARILPGGEHRPEWITTHPFIREGHPASRGPVLIGNDVWIGLDVLVLSGVTIGDGAVIGARSVVTRDVRPYAVVAGQPAVERRRRFTDEQIEALLDIAWWDWPEEEIEAAAPLLCSTGIEEFIRRHGR